MNRRRHNFLHGRLGAALDDASTSVEFEAPLPIPSLTEDEYLPLVLDPDGAPEIVHLVEYYEGMTTGSVVRAQEGTHPGMHGSGTWWRHGPLVSDFQPTAAELRLSAPVPLGSGTTITVPFDVIHRLDGAIALGTEVGLLRALASGWYQFSAGWRIESGLSSYFGTFLTLYDQDGTDLGHFVENQVSATTVAGSVTRVTYLEAGQQVSSRVYKGSSTARSIQADPRSHLSAFLLGS